MSKIPLWLRLMIVFLVSFILVSIIFTIMANTFDNEAVFGKNPNSTEPTVEGPKQVRDFTVYDADGNQVKLSDYFGKPIVVNFWASWCGPCKNEMPNFEEVYLDLGDEVQFLMVNLTDGSRETQEDAEAYIKSQGYTMPVFYDKDMDATVAFAIFSVPQSYFIDADGVLQASASGGITTEQLRECIAQIYKP